jgi:RHS repeat-associated protein
MSQRTVTTATTHVEYKPDKRRQVTAASTHIEYKLDKRRQVTAASTHVEYKLDKRRQVTAATLMAELGLRPPNTGRQTCDGMGWTGTPTSDRPVSLLTGEKFEEATDLTLTTPTGVLAFTRHYRQARQADFQFMGAGWTHNHRLTLTQIAGTPNRILVVRATGGEAHFTETTTNNYSGVTGVGASIVVDPGSTTSRYTLTATDKSLYIFDSAGKLRSQAWPSGEVWTYSYDGSNRLSEVNDGYNRKLVFSYYSSGAFSGLLYRVGDHTFDDTNPSSPTGRYVEYSYTLNKVVDSTSAIVNGTVGLLTGVRDVRGQTWTYNYYGQNASETDVRQLNFLTRHISPSVDTTGDGTVDGPITVKNLAYTMQGVELAVNGGMEADSDWPGISGAAPTTNIRSSAQVDSGSFARYVEAALNNGIEGTAWALIPGRTYIITARVYPITGTVQMQVTGESAFTRTSSGTGAWQTLRAVYQATAGSTGRKLQFVAASSAAQFYVDTVSILESNLTIAALLQEHGNAALSEAFAFQPGGQNITTETTAGKTSTHQFNDELYIGVQDPAGHVAGQTYNYQFRPDIQTDANGNPTALGWSTDGKLLTRVVDAQNNTTQFTYDGSERLQSSLDAQGRKTKYLYGDMVNTRVPTEVKVFNDAAETTLLAWQRFAYDNRARTILETTLDSADSAIETAFERTSSGTGSWQTLTASYTPSANAPGRHLQFVASGSAAEFYVDTASILENGTTQLAVNGGMEADSGWPSIGEVPLEVNERSTTQVDSGTYSRHVKATAGVGIEGNTWDLVAGRSYTISARVYVVSGAAKMRVVKPQAQVGRSYYIAGTEVGRLKTVTQQDLGGANSVTTTYFYDTYGRVIQTNQNTTFGSCTSSYTVYDLAGNVVASICNYDPGMGSAPTNVTQAVALFNPSFLDKNWVTTHEYDTLNRRVKTTTDAGASYALTSLTVYDALDRVVRTIANYVSDVGVPHPYTAARTAFAHGAGNTQNLVTDTSYNARGLVRSQTDVLGNVTLFGYDDADRLVKIVASASTPTYNNDYTGTNPDPTLASYTASSAVDKDIITTNQFDPAGNLVKTVDVLGNVSYTMYDVLNRPVKTVRNAKDAATIALNPGDGSYNAANDPRSASYTPDSAADRDLIDLTEYDAMGRVKRTQDVNGAWTLFGYDAMGRQIKAIRSASNPTYNSAADPTLASYSPSSDADLDLITTTTFDSTGRVLYTTDVQGQRQWTAYDGLQRVVKTIGNAIGTATDGGTNDPRSGSYTPSTDSDKDLIVTTTFDSSGRVQWTQDKLGNKTWYVYDSLSQIKKIITNCTYTSGTPAPEEDAYTGSNDSDKDIITRRTFDSRGRVVSIFDAAGYETRYEYDVLGRRTKTTINYVNGVFDSNFPDEDLISTTIYDLIGRVVTTTDMRGTQTSFTYDAVDRTLTVTQAANTALTTTGYTCYDKADRVLRTITNYRPAVSDPLPDARDGSGNWLFAPATHGLHEDENLITTFTLDRLGRQTAVTDVMGNTTTTTYFKDGQADAMTDMLGVVTLHRYDKLRRRTTAVTGYQSNDQDPALWVWDATDNRWEKSDGTAISYGTANDRNVIVRATFNKRGQLTALRDPRGKQTTYSFDLLSRRTGLTDPLGHTWATTYTNPGSGTTRVTLTDPLSFQTRQDFDRAGRLTSLAYLSESPKLTPDVTFTYTKRGERTLMSESDGSSTVRRTTYSFDKAYRLTSVGFDNDGNGTVDQTVSYQYDAGGLRTRLTLPGSLNVDYAYNAKGELTTLNDWSSQASTFAYNNVGRLLLVGRANGLNSRYRYDAGGRLRLLRHEVGSKTLGHFAYTVDGRGNRTQVLEVVPRATTGSTTMAATDAAIDYFMGSWTTSGAFRQSTNFSAALRLLFFGNQATLTMGTGSDHSIYDVVVNGALWQAFDGYAAASGEQTHTLTLDNEGPHLLEVRNRAEKNLASSSYKIRFKQLVTDASGQTYDAQAISYTYDALSRLAAASYFPGANTAATAFRQYAYSFDLAGNRTQQVVTISGTPTSTSYTYDAANRLATSQLSGGPVTSYTYDNAGRLTSDGTNAYIWDRANRLLSYNSTAYQYGYDGDGRRVNQVISGIATQYLLDIQPGLAQIMESTTGTNTTRYMPGPIGLLTQYNPDSSRRHMIADGLSNVRGVVDSNMLVLQTNQFAPYGESYGQTGTSQTVFGFTGEPSDGNGLVYLRARYYNPTSGVFTGPDPFEGDPAWVGSLNRYSYVRGNVTNRIDPSGMCEVLLPGTDPITDACHHLALDIAKRLSGGDPAKLRMLYEILVQKSFTELLYIHMVGIYFDLTSPLRGNDDGTLATADSLVWRVKPDWQKEYETDPTKFPESLREAIDRSDDCRRRNIKELQDPYKNHIALGLGNVTPGVQDSGAPDLEKFTENLNVKYDLNRVEDKRNNKDFKVVVHDRIWHTAKYFRNHKPLSSTYPFPKSFYEAFEKILTGQVVRIHFNLEGILAAGEATSYADFAKYSGNKGVYVRNVGDNRDITNDGITRKFRVTAWELYNIIIMPNVCKRMTSFYSFGTQSVGASDLADPEIQLKSQVCDSI